jgi:hypothetical protein
LVKNRLHQAIDADLAIDIHSIHEILPSADAIIEACGK